MNNKGATAQTFIIAMLLISTVVALGYLMVQSLATDYYREDLIDDSFSSNYDKLSDNTQVADEMLHATSSTTGLSILGTAEILLSSTFSVISLIFGSLTTMSSQLLHIGEDFNIPSQVSSILIITFLAGLTVFIVFTIINAVNKTNRL